MKLLGKVRGSISRRKTKGSGKTIVDVCEKLSIVGKVKLRHKLYIASKE